MNQEYLLFICFLLKYVKSNHLETFESHLQVKTLRQNINKMKKTNDRQKVNKGILNMKIISFFSCACCYLVIAVVYSDQFLSDNSKNSLHQKFTEYCSCFIIHIMNMVVYRVYLTKLNSFFDDFFVLRCKQIQNNRILPLA